VGCDWDDNDHFDVPVCSGGSSGCKPGNSGADAGMAVPTPVVAIVGSFCSSTLDKRGAVPTKTQISLRALNAL
jgi:hypothetical protein